MTREQVRALGALQAQAGAVQTLAPTTSGKLMMSDGTVLSGAWTVHDTVMIVEFVDSTGGDTWWIDAAFVVGFSPQ